MSVSDYRAGRSLGENYYLPRAMLMAKVVVSPSAGARVLLSHPEIIADTGASGLDVNSVTREQYSGCAAAPAAPAVKGPFSLSHRVTGLHKDTMIIEVDQGLLKSVSADTEEQLSDSLIAAGKSAGALGLEAGLLEDDEEIISAYFDPADCLQVAAVENLIEQAINGEGLQTLRKMQKESDPKSPLRKLTLDSLAPIDFELALNGFKPFRTPSGLAATQRSCRLGICVVIPVPATMLIKVGGRRLETPMMRIPNRSEPVAIPISRSAFTDVKTTLTLDRGMLTKREITRGSEALAILSLPASIVGAYLDELSAGFKKRKTAIDDRIALEEAKKKRLEAEAGVEGPGPLAEIRIPGLSLHGVGGSPVRPQANPGGAEEEGGDTPATRESPQGDVEDTKKPGGKRGGNSGKGS